MLVCLVSQIDQLKANFKLHPQRSQHVDSYVIVAGVEIKFVNFISFQLEHFSRCFQTFAGNNADAVIFPSPSPSTSARQSPVRYILSKDGVRSCGRRVPPWKGNFLLPWMCFVSILGWFVISVLLGVPTPQVTHLGIGILPQSSDDSCFVCKDSQAYL